jgi:hypothetical protein
MEAVNVVEVHTDELPIIEGGVAIVMIFVPTHDPPTWQVIVTVPAETLVTTPEAEPTVAIPVLLLDHVPERSQETVPEEPMQMTDGPSIHGTPTTISFELLQPETE